MNRNVDFVIMGGNADGLALAAALAESGKRVVLLDSRMKVGGELLTESFLTPHRYDLAGGWLLSERLARLNVAEFDRNNERLMFPEIPLAQLFTEREPFLIYRSANRTREQLIRRDRDGFDRLLRIGQAMYLRINGALVRPAGFSPGQAGTDMFGTGMTVRQTLDDLQLRDERLRCALTYLPLALGHEIRTPGSGAALAYLLSGLMQSSVVRGGSGLLAMDLADAIARRGGLIIESAEIAAVASDAQDIHHITLKDNRVFSTPVMVAANDDPLPLGPAEQADQAGAGRLGNYRIYLGFAREPAGFRVADGHDSLVNRAHMIGFGFESEQDVYTYLESIEATQPPFVAGHLISNSFQNPENPVGALGELSGDLWCTACHGPDPGELAASVGNSGSQDSIPGIRAEMSAATTRPRDADDRAGLRIRPRPGSAIWQGVLPMQIRSIDLNGFRKSFEDACIEQICARLEGVEADDVRFRLTWLPQEVREPLLRKELVNAPAGDAAGGYRTAGKHVYRNPHARLARHTGFGTAGSLISFVSAAAA